MTDGGLSAGDVLALTKNNSNDMFGGNWGGIIGLLIIAGIFGNGGFFGNNNNNIEDEFVKRDIFNTNTNVSNQGTSNLIETLNAKYDNAINTLNTANQTQRDVLENSFTNQLGFANSQKDILLGNQALQSQLSSCCCDIKTAIHSEGEATRALINQIDKENLTYQLNQANTAVANAVQTQNILGTLGNWYSKPAVNPYMAYNCCGSNI